MADTTAATLTGMLDSNGISHIEINTSPEFTNSIGEDLASAATSAAADDIRTAATDFTTDTVDTAASTPMTALGAQSGFGLQAAQIAGKYALQHAAKQYIAPAISTVGTGLQWAAGGFQSGCGTLASVGRSYSGSIANDIQSGYGSIASGVQSRYGTLASDAQSRYSSLAAGCSSAYDAANERAHDWWARGQITAGAGLTAVGKTAGGGAESMAATGQSWMALGEAEVADTRSGWIGAATQLVSEHPYLASGMALGMAVGVCALMRGGGRGDERSKSQKRTV